MKRGMKMKVNNNEIRGENCILEQVYRVNDIQMIERAIQYYETEGCDHERRVRNLFTCILWRHEYVILCSSSAAAEDGVW
jgi:hypothetical protein